MKKEKIEVIEYKKIDNNYNFIINLLKRVNDNTNLTNLLVYYDSNYPNYFKRLIEDSNNDLVTILKINDEIVGLIHLKKEPQTIFLNNISLSKYVQGRGFGKYFLKTSLSFINFPNYKFFALDVFESNNKAFCWYKKLGLETIKNEFWLEILPLVQGGDSVSNVNHKKDLNGFDSLFIEKEKVATIINQNIIVHNIFKLSEISLQKFKRIITKQDILPAFTINYRFKRLENSFRMQGDLNKIYQMLL